MNLDEPEHQQPCAQRAGRLFEIRGTLRIDPRRGVLLEHEEELRMRVELRPHPALGEGGTMASRLERTRVRVGPSAPEAAPSP